MLYFWQLNQSQEIDKKSEKEDKSYEVQVLEQVKYLDVVIEKIKNFKHVDISNIFILGSSMGGATAATS